MGDGHTGRRVRGDIIQKIVRVVRKTKGMSRVAFCMVKPYGTTGQARLGGFKTSSLVEQSHFNSDRYWFKSGVYLKKAKT